jgi:hypothetical protein
MKRLFGILFVAILFLVQACSAGNATEASSPQEPIAPPPTETSMPNASQPIIATNQPEVSQSTAVVLPALPTITPSVVETGVVSDEGNPPPEGGVTLDDNGKAFNMKVGDSFLLNLGTDAYDWTVTIDNESVLHLKMGVMVIRGAQGIYDALAPGTAILSASGDPLCLKSRPACGMPSILFTVTVIVR